MAHCWRGPAIVERAALNRHPGFYEIRLPDGSLKRVAHVQLKCYHQRTDALPAYLLDDGSGGNPGEGAIAPLPAPSLSSGHTASIASSPHQSDNSFDPRRAPARRTLMLNYSPPDVASLRPYLRAHNASASKQHDHCDGRWKRGEVIHPDHPDSAECNRNHGDMLLCDGCIQSFHPTCIYHDYPVLAGAVKISARLPLLLVRGTTSPLPPPAPLPHLGKKRGSPAAARARLAPLSRSLPGSGRRHGRLGTVSGPP
jgi:hypothetical protein